MKERLEQVYRRAERISIDRSSKIVCMSDCHRGVGNPGDNFLSNQNIFLAALRYYYEGCFCYIEPGEGFYLNDGCCVRPQGITAIEIERGAVTLVKWSVVTRPNRNLAVEREVLEGPYPWEQYWENRK